MTDAERDELRALIRDTISTEFSALKEAAEIAAQAAYYLEFATKRLNEYPIVLCTVTRQEFTAMSEQLRERIRKLQMGPTPVVEAV